MYCNTCKKDFEPEFKSNGEEYKTCTSCREKSRENRMKYKCEHGKRRSRCKDCGGGSICEHDKIRSSCKDCGGSEICEHDKRRSTCKDCGGSEICEHDKIRSRCKECEGGSICEHDKIRSTCKDCGGGGICEHDKIRSRCKDCGGGGICEHDKIRSRCKECEGGSICEHDKRRSQCKDCRGSEICEHDKRRYRCKDCGGSGICEHNRQRSRCKDCGGSEICEHNIRRSECIICTPSRSCQNCKRVYVPSRYRFHPYCFSCYCVLNPDVEIPRKYKLKEHYFREFLKEEYKDIELVFDKIVGESNKRPDVLISFEEYNVVLELDENQHRGYDCESKRIMEIFQDLGSKPLVMLRINPDTYLDSFGKRVPGCFKSTKTIGWKKDEIEWKRRLDIVKDQLNYFMENPPEKEVDINYFFYNEL
jgi:hypothetical protein